MRQKNKRAGDRKTSLEPVRPMTGRKGFACPRPASRSSREGGRHIVRRRLWPSDNSRGCHLFEKLPSIGRATINTFVSGCFIGQHTHLYMCTFAPACHPVCAETGPPTRTCALQTAPGCISRRPGVGHSQLFCRIPGTW